MKASSPGVGMMAIGQTSDRQSSESATNSGKSILFSKKSKTLSPWVTAGATQWRRPTRVPPSPRFLQTSVARNAVLIAIEAFERLLLVRSITKHFAAQRIGHGLHHLLVARGPRRPP